MRILSVIAVILLIAATVVFVITTRQPSSDGADNANAVRTRTPDQMPPTDPTTNSDTNAPNSREQMLAVARLFAERYGTVTSGNPNAHLESVKSFASDGLKATFERMKKNDAGTLAAGTATTSQALSFSVKTFNQNQGRADVAVSLQRREQSGTSTPHTYMQDLNLTLMMERGSWKVSVAAWGPAK